MRYVPNSCTKHRVFRVGEFNCAKKICMTSTRYHGNENFEILTKFAITPVVYKIDSSFLALLYGFRGRPIKLCSTNLTQTDPCCHGNENLRFSTHTDARNEIIGS